MQDLVEELSRKARALPTEDRARVAEELLASLDENRDRETEAAWDHEIRRRIAEIEDGTAKLVSAKEVFAEVRNLFK